MKTKRDFKSIVFKRLFLILILSICTILCIELIPYIDNQNIIALSASAEQPIQAGKEIVTQQQIPAKESPVVIQNQADPSVNVVTQAAVKLGILSCVSRINQVAGFLTANNRTGVFIFKPQNQPDQHIFTTSFELIRNDDSTIYASASFFPNQDAVYDTVEYVDKSCEEVEKTIFSNLKRISVIKKNVIVLDGGAVKVFLMPAGNGTIVIKKEVIQ